MNIFCRMGFHRDLVTEERHYLRTVTPDGETVGSLEHKVCRCGAVIETKSHSSHESTITTTTEETNASHPNPNTATTDAR